MMCKNSVMSDEVCQSCSECRSRALAGPKYDPLRGTGRTSNAVKAAVMAAAFGQRVVYLCGNQASADHANSLAREFVEKSLGKECAQRVSMSKERITFYFANGNCAGILVFRSIAAQDINIGMRQDCKFREVEDHYATEVKAERQHQVAKAAAKDEIVRLMRLYGFTGAGKFGVRQHIGTFINFD